MSEELKACPFCGSVPDIEPIEDCEYINCSNLDCIDGVYCLTTKQWNTRPIEDALRAELEKRTAGMHDANAVCMEMKHELDRLKEENHALDQINRDIQTAAAHLDEVLAELEITDKLLKEATETIGAVIACCTYNSNEDAKIGIYGIDQNAFTKIDQFITHYNDAVSAGKVSTVVKRDLSDAEIEELGAQEAERKEFCPNCEAIVPCTHEAELFVCDICGEDFAKYIVSRNCSVSDVSMTEDVLTDIKTPQSIENTNPDYYKQEIARLNAERRWIPVSERLPEYGEPSLTIYHTKNATSQITIRCLVEDRDDKLRVIWYDIENGLWVNGNNITHWMPLPPPPEGE